MRRLLLVLLSAAGLMSAVAGCCHTHGVCDCVGDPDPCLNRAPWAVGNGHFGNGHLGNGYGAPPVTSVNHHVGELPKAPQE